MNGTEKSFYSVCPGEGSESEECKDVCQDCSMCGAHKWEYTTGCPECMECLERNGVEI